ncbi:solute carrier family 66 member 2 isoform X2 [Brevipalpus obovatus]|uniref:solute carrier family 66 member 2 isoform X2 n=1 Tax=Brevipalpus obovatus TaxID=246614 RepID=UPI003D9EAFE9
MSSNVSSIDLTNASCISNTQHINSSYDIGDSGGGGGNFIISTNTSSTLSNHLVPIRPGQRSGNEFGFRLLSALNMAEEANKSTIYVVANLVNSLFLMFGGALPYIPQYLEISEKNDAEGFSMLVCFILLIANITRIFYWIGQRYNVVLLYQSFIMIFVMFAMIEICVRVKQRTTLVPSKNRFFFDSQNQTKVKPEPNVRRFLDFDMKYFWDWTDFISYLEFTASYTVLLGLLTYSFYGTQACRPYTEAIGYFSLLVESTLALPQLIKNQHNKSTKGLSKIMVALWATGDIYKTIVFFFDEQISKPFVVCGVCQITIDLLIAVQVYFYGQNVHPKGSLSVPIKPAQS